MMPTTRKRWPLDVTGWIADQAGDRLTRWLAVVVLVGFALMAGAQFAHKAHAGREEQLQMQRDAARAQRDDLLRRREGLAQR